jgi:hypothetical protein
MTAQGYQVIMCDPPWPVEGHVHSSTRMRRLGEQWRRDKTPYTTLPWSALWSLIDTAILSQAAPEHALFLWTLEQFLTDTEAELMARGYVRAHRIIWDKVGGVLTPTLFRSHKYLLWYCWPRLLPIAPGTRGRNKSVICEGARQHSRKPSAAYALVEALYPDARKLDAFSREYRPGWSAFGDQVDHFTPLLAPLREVQA